MTAGDEAPGIVETADRWWRGEADLRDAEHPVRPWAGRSQELADGVLYFKGIASATTLDTGDGLVMLDTGHRSDTARLHDAVRRWRSEAPLRAAVFSHHHVDHVFGTGPFETEAAEAGAPAPVVYAHEGVPGHFARYRRTLGWNTAINVRQFAIPDPDFAWPGSYREPDVTYRDQLRVRVGGLTLQLQHARGETDDATWTFVPELGLLHPGDLFIWAVPNAGNPQKVQRYVGEWATALRRMAALDAEVMVPGHGLPVLGTDRIRTALTDTAELLESIEQQTLALMNQGVALDTVLHEVSVPDHLRDRPWLRPVYDHPQFLVRSVWRLFGGWYDGEPDNLLPAPRVEQARVWVDLAGGTSAVLDRARDLVGQGDLRLACHLVEFAVLTAPDDPAVHETRTAVYRARSQQQESSMARNILGHAALASEQGRRDLAGVDRRADD